MRIRWTIATSLKALLLTLLLAPTALHAEPTAGERATAPMLERKLSCVRTTPLGNPVVPEV